MDKPITLNAEQTEFLFRYVTKARSEAASAWLRLQEVEAMLEEVRHGILREGRISMRDDIDKRDREGRLP